MSKRRCPDLRGFTLIETLVSLAILAMALMALLQLRQRDISLSALANHMTEATLLANARMASANLSSRVSEGNVSGYHWKEELLETPFEGVKALHVTVAWQEGRSPETVEMTTYLFE